MFAIYRKLNLISLEHICIPATCCCDDTSRGESSARDGERQRIQSCNRPAPTILLALHFLCMHSSGHTHQVKHRIFRMQVCIEHQHWANAQLMHLHTQG